MFWDVKARAQSLIHSMDFWVFHTRLTASVFTWRTRYTDPMLAQCWAKRRRRWPNIETELVERLVVAVMLNSYVWWICGDKLLITANTMVGTMLVQRRRRSANNTQILVYTSVFCLDAKLGDGRSRLGQRRANAFDRCVTSSSCSCSAVIR